MQKLSEENLIFKATIIEHKKNLNTTIYTPSEFTVLHVDRWFYNDYKTDTVYFANGLVSTQGSLNHIPIGKSLIIKSILNPISKNPKRNKKDSIEHSQIIEYHDVPDRLREQYIVENELCDVWILNTEQNYVIGKINSFYKNNLWERLANIFRSQQHRRESSLQYVQKMTFDRFDKQLKRRLKK